MKGSALPDVLAVAALTVIAFGAGRFAAVHSLNPPDLYYLAPAVPVAMGNGLRGMAVAPDSPLAHFLARRTTALSRTDAAPSAMHPPDAFQGWRDDVLYQRVRSSDTIAGLYTVVCLTGRSCRGLLGYLDRERSLPRMDDAAVGFRSTIATITPEGAVVDGAATSASEYFLQLKEITAPSRGAFVARGTLSLGSATIGLLATGQWHQQALVIHRGRFAFIAPLAPGAYVPLVTNAPTIGPRRSRLMLTHAGFLEAAR